MLLTACTFLQSINQPTNALTEIQQNINHKRQFTSIKLLNVSAPECQRQADY